MDGLFLIFFLIMISTLYVLLMTAWRAGFKAGRAEPRLQRLKEQTDVLLETLGLKPDEAALPPDVLKLIRAGEKIEAISRYRKHTGAGLKQAKDAVEGHEGLEDLELKMARVLRELHVTQAIPDTAPSRESAPDALAKIEALVSHDQMIAAIKEYRSFYGGGLREAKEAVEQIRLRQQSR